MFNGQITQQLNEQGTWRRECYAKHAEVLSKAKRNHILSFYQIWMKPWPTHRKAKRTPSRKPLAPPHR